MKSIIRKAAPVAITAAVVGALGMSGGAYAEHLIGSQQIKDDSIRSADIHDGAVRANDLSDGVLAKLNKAGTAGTAGSNGKDGKDGKAGIANVTTGAGYTHTWEAHSGLQTIVSKCAAGQVALGGGFSTWGGSDVNESGLAYDLGGDNKDIQVTVSAPYTGEAYDANKYGGDIRPDRWVVKGFNNGDTDQIVRAWVVCADAS